MKRLAFLLPLIIFALISIYFAAGLKRDPSRIPSALIDRPVPEFSMPAISEDIPPFSTNDIADKITLINVFASWCISCHVEHSFLMELSKRDDLYIAGLNWKERAGDGEAWLKQYGNPYDFVGDDPDGRVAIDFGVTGAPETFIVDAKGRIRFRFAGPITEPVWERDIKPVIDAIKNEGAGVGA